MMKLAKWLLLFLVIGGVATVFTTKPPPEPQDIAPTTTAPQQKLIIEVEKVKKVDGMYRYFYRLKSLEAVSFEGKHQVTLLSDKHAVRGKVERDAKIDNLWRGGYIETYDHPRNVFTVRLKAGETVVYGSVPKDVAETYP